MQRPNIILDLPGLRQRRIPPQTTGLEEAIQKLEMQAHARLQDLQFARASGNPGALLSAKQRFAMLSERLSRLYVQSGIMDGVKSTKGYSPSRC